MAWTSHYGELLNIELDGSIPSGNYHGTLFLFGGSTESDHQYIGEAGFLISVLPPTPIGVAKGFDEGSGVYIKDAVVTTEGLHDGSVFIESADRSSAVRILSNLGLAAGDRLSFLGTTGWLDGETVIEVQQPGGLYHGQELGALGMTNSAITTVDSEYSVPFGLMANGMLVTVWGTVSYTPEMAALLEKATGVAPYFIGKPNPFMMRSALRYLGVHSEEAVIVGDRMDTDIVAGMESGMETILVLTGVTKAEEIDRFPYRPTRVVPSVAEIELI